MWARLAVGLLVGHQSYVFLRSRIEKDEKYAAARRVADERGKPLLVVGGPWGSYKLIRLKVHDCGDMCVDIDPEACEGCRYTNGDIRHLPFPDGAFGAVFCSHVLEHMPTPEDGAQAWAELNRCADYVFICVPRKDSWAGWACSDHHLGIQQIGSDVLKIEDRHSPQVLYAYGHPEPAPAHAASVQFDLQRLIPVADTT